MLALKMLRRSSIRCAGSARMAALRMCAVVSVAILASAVVSLEAIAQPIGPSGEGPLASDGASPSESPFGPGRRSVLLPPPPTCAAQACAARWDSFRLEDCTYQPPNGPRRYCIEIETETTPASTGDEAAAGSAEEPKREAPVPIEPSRPTDPVPTDPTQPEASAPADPAQPPSSQPVEPVAPDEPEAPEQKPPLADPTTTPAPEASTAQPPAPPSELAPDSDDGTASSRDKRPSLDIPPTAPSSSLPPTSGDAPEEDAQPDDPQPTAPPPSGGGSSPDAGPPSSAPPKADPPMDSRSAPGGASRVSELLTQLMASPVAWFVGGALALGLVAATARLALKSSSTPLTIATFRVRPIADFGRQTISGGLRRGVVGEPFPIENAEAEDVWG